MDTICWNCKFFQHLNSGGTYPYGGYCRRYAPRGRDANGLAANKRYCHLQLGLVYADIFKAANSPLALTCYQALPSIPAAGGYNSDTIYPVLIDGNWMIEAMSFRASLANTGAATVGIDPKIQIEGYVIDGTSKTLYHTFDLDIDPADVGIEGNIVDHFCAAYASGLYTSDATGEHAIPFGGYAVKLTDDDPELIGEIRNPMLSILLSRYVPGITNATFPYLQRGDTMQCGDWTQNPGTIPVLP